MVWIVPGTELPAGAGDVYLARLRTYGITPTAVIPTSAQAAYPALSVTDYLHPQRPWKPTGVGDEALVLNLGSLLNLGAIHFGWFSPDTVANVHVQANPTNSWVSTPALDVTIELPSAFNGLSGRYAYTMVFPTGLAGMQYVRFFAPAHAGLPVALGQFLACRYTPLAIIPNRPGLEFGQRRATLENRFEGGGSEALSHGPRQLLLNFPWEYGWNPRDGAAPETTTIESTLQIDNDDPVLLVPDSVWQPQWGSVYRRAVSDTLVSSQTGIGASFALSFEEVL